MKSQEKLNACGCMGVDGEIPEKWDKKSIMVMTLVGAVMVFGLYYAFTSSFKAKKA